MGEILRKYHCYFPIRRSAHHWNQGIVGSKFAGQTGYGCSTLCHVQSQQGGLRI